ncbi:hypothetical protein N0V85_004382 [Neurospora sp. IMI 360204]|nr:hypothetical protein N0V85_004382 [Neurospora sp. IMI 360204]
MSISGVLDDHTPDFEALVEGYKTEIKQSLRTVRTLQDSQGIRLITTSPGILGEAEDIIRRMEEYEPKEGKRRVSTALKLYYEQAGKKLDNELGKKFQSLWGQLVDSAQEDKKKF